MFHIRIFIISMMMMMIMLISATNIHPRSYRLKPKFFITKNNNNNYVPVRKPVPKQQWSYRTNVIVSFQDWQRKNSTIKSTSWNCCLWMPMTNMVTHFGNPNCSCFLEFTNLPWKSFQCKTKLMFSMAMDRWQAEW